MRSMTHRFKRLIHLFVLLGGIACAFAAQAAYKYSTIDYPGAKHTTLFGISASGQVVGAAYFEDVIIGTSIPISFIYDSRKKGFTVLPNVPAAVTLATGIDAPGVVVGWAAAELVSAERSGIILKDGAYTMFSHPGSSSTQARAISNSGLVTGFAGNSVSIADLGFIYDPASNYFIDILIPSAVNNITQGINGRGEVVGSVQFQTGGAYPEAPGGNYGFLRRKSGAIVLFRVNGGQTRARGITNSGLITGYMTDPATGKDRAFVATLADSLGFQALTIPDAELLDVPGATGTVAQGINDSGYISGSWIDDTGATHGFIAAPH
jgi:hypothetical protein